MMTINYGLTKLSYHAIIHRHERSAPYRGVEQLAASLTAAGGRGREGAACAAVDKIEESVSPKILSGTANGMLVGLITRSVTKPINRILYIAE